MNDWARRLASPDENGTAKYCIATGASARIYLLLGCDGECVVAKWFVVQPGSAASERQFARETACLERIRHENVVSYLGKGMVEGKRVIFLEYMAGGDLYDWIGVAIPSEAQAIGVLRQVLTGLAALHAASIMHRDLKCENVLLADDADEPRIKICDFGLSNRCADGRPINDDFCGTSEYVAPEIWRMCNYNKSADVWSFGVLAFAVLTGLFPFGTIEKGIEPFVEEVMRGKLVWDSYCLVSDCGREFVGSCLQINPASRSSIKELLRHPWMNSDRD